MPLPQAETHFAAAMTPRWPAMLCFLLSLACSSAKIVWPGMAPVTVTAENYNAVTERFTIITKDDCHIAPKNTYTSIAVGGDLYDASCGTVRRTRATCIAQHRPVMPPAP